MAFHVDCVGRHGLISIESKPASYGALEWRCKACQRLIPDRHIGVLHCEQCRCDICPDCWIALLPRIENRAGYPCFWQRPPSAPSVSNLLCCHRRNVASTGGHMQRCGLLDATQPSMRPSIPSFGFASPPTPRQCTDCAERQFELQVQQAGAAAAAPPSAPPHQSGYLPQQRQSAGGGAGHSCFPPSSFHPSPPPGPGAF